MEELTEFEMRQREKRKNELLDQIAALCDDIKPTAEIKEFASKKVITEMENRRKL